MMLSLVMALPSFLVKRGTSFRSVDKSCIQQWDYLNFRIPGMLGEGPGSDQSSMGA